MPLIKDARPGLTRFLALIPVTADEEAAFANYQGFVVWGFRGSLADGTRELALEVAANDEEEARERADVIFTNWLTRSELERDELPPIRVITDEFVRRQRWFELRMVAKDLHQHGEQHDLAVIVAQTACEILIESTIVDLIRRRDEPLAEALGDMLRSYSFMDDRSRTVWAALTGERVEQQPFWPKYKAHVERRNAVAHRGSQVTEDEAGDSISAEVALFRYLMATWVRLL